VVIFTFISTIVLIIAFAVLVEGYVQLNKCFKKLESREVKLAEIVHEISKEDDPEEDTTKDEPKEMSPYEYAEMILRGKVDIENELRE
jgi:hypothetical protein